jgi:hypothetical protein
MFLKLSKTSLPNFALGVEFSQTLVSFGDSLISLLGHPSLFNILNHLKVLVV